jgi:hypothetical protein
MSYNGYLIKLGGSSGVPLPLKYIKIDSYKCTPNQRMESKATRSVTGLLHRTTVQHTATKVEFETPYINNNELQELNTLIRNAFTNMLERKLTINYYDQETDSYKNAEVYMPDVGYSISRIDSNTNTVYYDSVRYAFIEY